MTELVLHGVSPAALGAAVALGTAAAVAAFILLLSFGRRDRAVLRWLVPLAAVIPPTEVLRTQWRPLGTELDTIGVVGATAYGPVLITAAALVFGLSRPFARRSLARQPLFWVAVPNAFASVALVAMLVLSGTANAVTPGADTMLTKTTTAQLDATGRVIAGVTTTTDQIAMSAATVGTTFVAGSAIPTAGAGAGAHTLQGPGRVFLLVRGNALTTTAYYDGATATYSATAGPAIPTAVGAGGFSIPRGDGSFLLVVGGLSTNVYVLTPNAGGVGDWAVSTPAFTLQGATGAGAGAHAIKKSATQYVIVHGAGGAASAKTALTTIYRTPADGGGEGMAAGPATSATVGDGAVSLPLVAPNAGKSMTFLGGNTTIANVYDPTANTFSATGVTAAPAAIGAGGHALQYVDGTLGARWLVVNGNGAKNAFKYNPAGALNQALAVITTGGGGTPNIGAGAHSYERANGTFLLIAGGASTGTRIWTPGAGVTGSFTAAGPTLTAAAGVGSHSFQQTDGQLVTAVAGGSTVTNVHDAGYTGTYTSEMINPTIVDFWDQLSWTLAANLVQANTVRISVRTGTDATLPNPAGATAYQDFFPALGVTTGSGDITTATAPQGKRYIQVRVTLARATSTQPDTMAKVWVGSSGLAYDRTIDPTAPILSDYSLRFKRAQFVPVLPGAATAGVGFTASMSLKDSASPTQNTVTEYTGTHTIFFSGANTAPDGTAPTLTTGTVQPFGGNTAVPFTAGASPTATLTLYNAVPATTASSAVGPGLGTVTPADMTGIIPGARLLIDTGGTQEYVTVTGITATTFTATFVNSHGPGTYTVAQQPQVPSANENFTSTATAYYLCSGATACGAHGAITVVSIPVPVTVSPAAISAADSTTSVTPATLTQGGTATITTTLRDQYRNPINGVTVAYTSSRGATDSITPPSGSFQTGPPGFPNGQQQASITSNTIGTAIITVVAGATPLPSVTVSFTAPPGQAANVTLVKDTHALLTPANITTTNAQVSAGVVSLTASNAPAGAFCSTPAPCGVATQNASGAGAHTLQGTGGLYMTLNGGGANTASVYDGQGTFNSHTLRDSADVTQPIGAGAHSVLLTAGARTGQFLIVRGGGTNRTIYMDASFPQVPTPLGPNLTGNAGVGAFAVAISGSRYLIVHGGASTGTSIYQTATDTIVAGPTLSAAAGAGAHGITRSNGTVLLVLGNGAGNTSVFDPGANTAVAGPAVGVNIGAGGHAAQLTATSWLVVAGNTTASTRRFDTTATNPAPFTAGTALGGNAGAGAHTIQRADGTLLVVRGGATTATSTYTSGNIVAAGPTLSAAVGDGGHAFPQTDHRYVVILGNSTAATNLYDAGWVGTGTYATEYITRPDIDSWNKVAWTAAGAGAVTIQVEVANLNYSTTAVGGGAATVTPVSMAGITVGSRLVVDSGSLQETVTVSAVTATTFDATFANAHGAGATAWTISTSSTTSVAVGSVVVTPGSMQGIGVSTALVVDTGGQQETVTVTAVTATTFTATFTKTHGAASWPIVIQGAGLLAPALDALSATNPTTLTSTSPNKMARGVVTLTRAVPVASGAAAQVWIGSSGTQPTRTQTASPTLTSISLGYRSALFSLSAPTPQVAGVNFVLTVTLKDLAGATLTPYEGSHTLVFDGASTSPTAMVPTAGGVNFGLNTTLTFASGSVAPSATLFTAETAAVGAKETVAAVSLSTFRIAAGYTIEPDRASIVVLAADPNAAQSTMTASPASVPDNGLTASTITVTAKDAYGNLSPYRETTSTTTVTAGVGRIVTPASMTGIAVGSVLIVDTGLAQETVTVSAVTATTFTATFVNGHGPTSYPIQVLRGVSIVSDRPASDTLTPATGSVAPVTAVFGSSFVSTNNGTSTLTATITGGTSSIQLNVSITVTTTAGGGVDILLTPVDGAGDPVASVGAGTSFAIRVEVFNAGTLNVNTQFCNGTGGRTCTLTWTHTAGSAPDGTTPTIVGNTPSGFVITGGLFTTSTSFTFVCANSGGTLCLSQPAAQTVTLTATQASNGEVAIGTTAAIPVATGAPDAAKSFVMLSPSAAGISTLSCAPLATPCAPTEVKVWARVVDQFRNAAPAKSVTIGTDLGTLAAGGCTLCTDAYGYTTARTLTSTTAGTAQLTATVSGAPDVVMAAAAQATFFDSAVLRINNGTHFGTVLDAMVTKIPLAIVPTDGSNKPLIQQSGANLTSPTVTWSLSGTGTGALAGPGCNGTTTESGSVVATAYAAADRVTCVQSVTPGVITVTPTPSAGNAPTPYTFTVVGYYDITSTATPSGRVVDAEVDWDGSGVKIRAWRARP